MTIFATRFLNTRSCCSQTVHISPAHRRNDYDKWQSVVPLKSSKMVWIKVCQYARLSGPQESADGPWNTPFGTSTVSVPRHSSIHSGCSGFAGIYAQSLTMSPSLKSQTAGATGTWDSSSVITDFNLVYCHRKQSYIKKEVSVIKNAGIQHLKPTIIWPKIDVVSMRIFVKDLTCFELMIGYQCS